MVSAEMKCISHIKINPSQTYTYSHSDRSITDRLCKKVLDVWWKICRYYDLKQAKYALSLPNARQINARLSYAKKLKIILPLSILLLYVSWCFQWWLFRCQPSGQWHQPRTCFGATCSFHLKGPSECGENSVRLHRHGPKKGVTSTLKTKEVFSCIRSVPMYTTTQCHNPGPRIPPWFYTRRQSDDVPLLSSEHLWSADYFNFAVRKTKTLTPARWSLGYNSVKYCLSCFVYSSTLNMEVICSS
jgi:hypothetical protein